MLQMGEPYAGLLASTIPIILLAFICFLPFCVIAINKRKVFNSRFLLRKAGFHIITAFAGVQ